MSLLRGLPLSDQTAGSNMVCRELARDGSSHDHAKAWLGTSVLRGSRSVVGAHIERILPTRSITLAKDVCVWRNTLSPRCSRQQPPPNTELFDHHNRMKRGGA